MAIDLVHAAWKELNPERLAWAQMWARRCAEAMKDDKRFVVILRKESAWKAE